MARNDRVLDRPSVTQFRAPLCPQCVGTDPIGRRLDVVYGGQLQFESVRRPTGNSERATFGPSPVTGSAGARPPADRSSASCPGVSPVPTYRIAGSEGVAWLRGSHSFEALQQRLRTVAPSLEAVAPPPITAFVGEYGPVVTADLAEVYQLAPGKAKQTLEALEEEGLVRRERGPRGSFWVAVDGGAS